MLNGLLDYYVRSFIALLWVSYINLLFYFLIFISTDSLCVRSEFPRIKAIEYTRNIRVYFVVCCRPTREPFDTVDSWINYLVCYYSTI